MRRWRDRHAVASNRTPGDEPRAGSGELTDEQLEAVTGGGTTPLENFVGVYSVVTGRTSAGSPEASGDRR